MSEIAQPEKHSLSDNLRHLLEHSPGREISIGSILESVQEKGFGIILMILSLPSALPVPAPGYSTPFGIVLLIIGLQMLQGRQQPLLPARARALTMSREFTGKIIRAAEPWLVRLEYLIRPRLRWVGNRPGRIVLSLLVIVMSILMILPIPLTNTAPAMVIFLIGVGLSEEDGLFCLGACLLGAAAVLLYAIVLYIAWTLINTYGWSGLEQLKDRVRELLGF